MLLFPIALYRLCLLHQVLFGECFLQCRTERGDQWGDKKEVTKKMEALGTRTSMSRCTRNISLGTKLRIIQIVIFQSIKRSFAFTWQNNETFSARPPFFSSTTHHVCVEIWLLTSHTCADVIQTTIWPKETEALGTRTNMSRYACKYYACLRWGFTWIWVKF